VAHVPLQAKMVSYLSGRHPLGSVSRMQYGLSQTKQTKIFDIASGEATVGEHKMARLRLTGR
jgi:hypothetical protein